MGRPIVRRYQVGRVAFVLYRGSKRRTMLFWVRTHQKLVGVGVVVVVAVVLVAIHEHQLAAITLASVGEKFIDVLGEILTDRLFPGGEFMKEG